MQLVGDSLRKIVATRSETLKRPVQIKTDVRLTNVEKKELFAAGDKKDGVVVDYKFEVLYGSESDMISIEGAIFAVGEKKELEELAKSWKKKEQKLESDLTIPIINRAMEIAYLTVIPLAKELRLPTPIQLPRFMKKEKEKEDSNYVG